MATKFFNGLNYTLSNEDTTVEYSVLPQNINHLTCVAGSGSRVIPLIAKSPRFVTCIDTSQEQLFLTEMRIEAVRTLSYEEYIYFLGYPSKEGSFLRKELFKKLSLSVPAEEYFLNIFNQLKWEGILYQGKWEKTFKLISKITRAIIGKKGTDLFLYNSQKEYQEYVRTKFPYGRWRLAVKLLGNAMLFNTLLYKGNFPSKNIPETFTEFYINAFNRIFEQEPICNNYFMQIIILGEIKYPSGLPLECNLQIFESAKKALQNTDISYVLGDIYDKSAFSKQADFISLSDVPSYLKGENESNFVQLLKDKLTNSGIIVARYYLHIPQKVKYEGFKNITETYTKERELEKVQMYKIEILKKGI